MLEIEKLLIEVSAIRQRYEYLAKVTGENFNVFKIVKIAEDEVKHSAFLAELLNPKGSHGQGAKFLQLFVDQLKISDFNCETAIVETEKYIGPVTETTGGQIDIFIDDRQGNCITIENKIYAYDQSNQLIRYFNFMEQHHYKKGELYYLTLDGSDASPISTENTKFGLKLEVEKHYELKSYETDIMKWLELCQKEAVSLPFIRETIHQYINLIKRLTGQSINIKMRDDIFELFKNNENYLEVAQDIANALISFEKEVRDSFFTLLHKKADKNLRLANGNYLFLNSGEDGDGIYFGFCLKNNKLELINTSEIGEKYSNILKKIHAQMFYNEWNIGWFNPSPIIRRQKFNDLDRKQRFEMYINTEILEQFVDKLIANRDSILNKFLEEIYE